MTILPDRFIERFTPEPNSGCWIWDAASDPKGYGRYNFEGKLTGAHRFSYETLVGPIPEGLQLDHLCRVRCCVNPTHLEPVTCAENLRRGEGFAAKNAVKTHCVQGHPYDEENTYITPKGKRDCRICRRKAVKRWRASH